MVIDCLSIVGIYAHICALSWSSPAESHQRNYVPSAHLQSYAPSNCYPSKTSARQKSWTDAGTDGPEGRRLCSVILLALFATEMNACSRTVLPRPSRAFNEVLWSYPLEYISGDLKLVARKQFSFHNFRCLPLLYASNLKTQKLQRHANESS